MFAASSETAHFLLIATMPRYVSLSGCKQNVLIDAVSTFYSYRTLFYILVKQTKTKVGRCNATCGEGVRQIITVTISGTNIENFEVSNHISTEPCYLPACPAGMVYFYVPR